jgi:hypothetical protein
MLEVVANSEEPKFCAPAWGESQVDGRGLENLYQLEV